MVQTADVIMISAIYLVFISCISVHATNIPIEISQYNTTNGNIGQAFQELFMAEQLIQSAKEIVSDDMQELQPTDCEDLLTSGEIKSGVYLVWPKNRIFTGSVSVYCDMITDGGGWTVIQRRGDFHREKDFFHQDWKAYKEGFGNLKEDFWLGNDNIYALTSQKLYSIRFDLGAFDGNRAYAEFSKFWIEDESNSYKLHVSGYSGIAGDSFSYHNSHKFSTKDRDNDAAPNINCAQNWKGAWWFADCHQSNLNGEYHTGRTKMGEGIVWNAWKGNMVSLRLSEMKIRKHSSWIK